ncbi:MAG TPA: hypothetical protein VJ577_15850 [Burkholderiaceae bacterium]|nr:hypothetical protein [Burkholderiaceae bacterium]
MKAQYRLLAIIGFGSSLMMAQLLPTLAQDNSPMRKQIDAATQSGQDQYQATEDQSSMPTAGMEAKTENGFTYLCGGVGESESTQIKQTARNYDMMLTFATRRGNYLADVDVNIKDAKGNALLQTTCDAPIMLINFPKSGVYRISAEAAGYTLNKTARVQAKRHAHAALVMLWPQQVADSAEPQPTSSGSSGTPNDADTHSKGDLPRDTESGSH